MERISSAIAISALALLATAGIAKAQDWTPIWTGPTVGISGGYGWGTSKHTDAGGFDSGKFNLQGGLAGGGLGYNYQIQHFVLGAEADYSAADINGKTGGGNENCIPPYCTTEAQTIGTARGRLGYAFGRFMPYVTGGFAWGQIHGSEGIAGVFGGGLGHAVHTGWTAGTGIEVMVIPGWSVKAEYLHVDLGASNSFTDTFVPAFSGTGTLAQRVSFQADTVRAGITFHFWTPRPMMAEAAPPPPAPMPVAAPQPAPVPQARTFIVFFDFDKFNLTPDARKVVEEAANAYKAGGSPKVTLAGYTDLSGSVPYNLRLSERRAKTVAAYMSKQGVPASAMDVSWHGKENPRVPTPDGVREPQNRRVEISE